MPHVILLWASQFDDDPFPKNEEIIEGRGPNYSKFSKGFVYWGKFFCKFDDEGNVEEVFESESREAYQESRRTFCEAVNTETSVNHTTYIYLSNPYSLKHRLIIANVRKALYSDAEFGGLPEPDEDGRPACAYMPDYFFHHKAVTKCPDCRSRKPECRMRFGCHFWFQVDAFLPIPPEREGEHFSDGQLRFWDDEQKREGDIFIPTHSGLLFPILVEQVHVRRYSFQSSSARS